MISSGELHPGQRLPSQRALSASLQVSVQSVREALYALAGIGLLETRHGSGTYVSSLEPRELMRPLQFALALSGKGLAELFDVRLLLEPPAAGTAAARRTDGQLAEMRACVEAEQVRSITRRRRLDLDAQLHDAIVRASHNDLLIALMSSIWALGIESRKRTVELTGVVAKSRADHARIVEAIAERDGAAAETAMRRHILNVRDAATAAGLPADVSLIRRPTLEAERHVRQ
jgi:GntR family transcriptional repressor for pyruvate dehydrogenase complex